MEVTAPNAAKTILIADDDLRLIKLLKENLQAEGYIVYCGFDGGMAVSLAKKHHPDVILMDVNMPYMDGLKAFRTLRATAETANIPVVFISEMMSQVIYPIVESSPRAAHLKKPLDLIDLTSFLRHFIQRYAA